MGGNNVLLLLLIEGGAKPVYVTRHRSAPYSVLVIAWQPVCCGSLFWQRSPREVDASSLASVIGDKFMSI